MANKTFADFALKGSDPLGPIVEDDYIVGYRPAVGGKVASEIKISAQDFANTLNDFLNTGSIDAENVGFNGTGSRTGITVNEKLSEFYVTSDYENLTTAAQNAQGQRLFVPSGATLVITISNSTSLKTVLNNIRNWHIEGTVQIKLNAGTWTISSTEAISLNHPYGQNIQIIGDTYNTLANINVRFVMSGSNGFDMFTCTNGCTFGLINGIAITGLGNTPATYAGIKADAGSLIQLGNKVTVSNCKNGIAADRGATIIADGVQVTNCTYGSGFYARNRSHISAYGAISNYNLKGYTAENHSQIYADNSLATYNSTNGYSAFSNSQIGALNATANYNTGSGFYAQNAGYVECHGAVAIQNGRFGVEFNSHGVVNGTGNLNTNLYTSLSSWTNGAAVTSSAGSLYVRTPDSSSLVFNTNNNQTQLEVSNTNGVISHVAITGGDANSHSTISVANAEASSDIVGLKIYPGSNYKYVDLGSKVRFGNYVEHPVTLPDGVTASGYITCQDSDGFTRRLLVL
jgi:hypothetical protein